MSRCRRARPGAVLLTVLSVVAIGAPAPAAAAPRGDWSVIAHRGHQVVGKHARHTENTMPALKAALRTRAPAVEVDLVLTADLQPLVMHDLTLDRTTTCTGPVADRSLGDIRAACRGRVRGERIPTLDTVLAWAKANRRNVVLDLKGGSEPWTHEQLMLLLEQVRAAGMTDRISLLSFYAAVLARAKEVDPSTRTQWILGGPWPGAAYLATRADAVNVHARELTPGRVRALRQHGVEVFGRVSNRPADWRRLSRAGVDGLLTDRADRAVRARRR